MTSLGEESDNGTADVVDVLASSTMSSSTPCPTSYPPEVPRPPPPLLLLLLLLLCRRRISPTLYHLLLVVSE